MEEIKTLKDHVYSYIAEQIRTGGMHPNQRVDRNVWRRKFACYVGSGYGL